MKEFSAIAVQGCDRLRNTPCRRDLLQPRPRARENDRAVRPPTPTEVAGCAAKNYRRSAGERHLLELSVGGEANPSAVRRIERCDRSVRVTQAQEFPVHIEMLDGPQAILRTS